MLHILKRSPEAETIWLTNTVEEDNINLLRRQKDIEDDIKLERKEMEQQPQPRPLIAPVMLAEAYFDKFRQERDFVWIDILREAVTEEVLIIITRMNRSEYDEWRNRAIKISFEAKLSIEQQDLYKKACKKPERMFLLEKTLNIEQRHLYKRWHGKEIPLVPPFFQDMKLDKKTQTKFLKLCSERDFVSLHYLMVVYGKFELLYKWWETASLNRRQEEDK